MSELCLVINLGSSSLKAALVDSTGACPWQRNRQLEPKDDLPQVLEDWLAPALEPFRHSIALIAHRVVHGGERFTAPTLIIHSRDDPMHPLSEARKLAANIANAELLVYDTSNHMPIPGHRLWDRFVTDVLNFLSEA